ncbi:DUF4212 domain-containing protein [Thermosulfurimonas dismutans]|uniref:Sodium:solute symporter associated protein n=1 Tax=Thermosulfurimonas dismutans TaxID=999894 RepID=A0A179D7B9_9BACT|nr:DUF4212 domain-containing protein [Thermosulfurimonas dismutans]OAQ21681.1 Sodium:solute symporter associated protein [Thermosulfurimonas dismutans]
MSLSKEQMQSYWRKNLKYIVVLLAIWFTVSYLCGIIFVDVLDKIKLGGYPLGFWFACQGSEMIFVVLIAVYVKLMNKLDKEFGVAEI